MIQIINNYFHQPVLLKEVIEILSPQPGENFVDATLGGGGYSKAIAELIKPIGKVLAIDLDKDAINSFINSEKKINNILVEHANFLNIDQVTEKLNFKKIKGIVADIGLSSYQLDLSGRGISFQKNEILDMRFDSNSSGNDARKIINTYPEVELKRIFIDFGEEKYSGKIVKKILDARKTKQEIKFTKDLYEIIVNALPKPVRHKAADSARRVFQALRIEVNHELENLKKFIPKAFELLQAGGKLVIVSFHSLEDRIVKQNFLNLSKGCICPPDFPTCVCGKKPLAKVITKKPIVASEEEAKQNSRAIPAKLRAIIKL